NRSSQMRAALRRADLSRSCATPRSRAALGLATRLRAPDSRGGALIFSAKITPHSWAGRQSRLDDSRVSCRKLRPPHVKIGGSAPRPFGWSSAEIPDGIVDHRPGTNAYFCCAAAEDLIALQ